MVVVARDDFSHENEAIRLVDLSAAVFYHCVTTTQNYHSSIVESASTSHVTGIWGGRTVVDFVVLMTTVRCTATVAGTPRIPIKQNPDTRFASLSNTHWLPYEQGTNLLRKVQ